MDIAQLQLTIDGRPAFEQVATVDAALRQLPVSARAAAEQVNAAFRSVAAQLGQLQGAQATANATTTQATGATQNYTGQLAQLQTQLGQINASLSNLAAQNRTVTTTTTQAAQATATAGQAAGGASAGFSGLNLSLGRFIGAFAALTGVHLGLRTMRDLVVQSVEADIAMQRLRLTVETFAGTATLTTANIQFLRQEADRIGTVFTTTSNAFAKFAAATEGTRITTAQARDIFVAFAEAGTRLHLGQREMSSIFLALEQMASKGVVSMEELRRQLGQYLPGAFNMAARAAGMTTQEFNKAVAEGRILSEDLLPKLAEEVRKVFPLGDAAHQTQAEINRIKNAWQDLMRIMGEETRGFVQGALRELRTEMDKIRALLRPETSSPEARVGAAVSLGKYGGAVPIIGPALAMFGELSGPLLRRFGHDFETQQSMAEQENRLATARALRGAAGPPLPERPEDAESLARLQHLIRRQGVSQYEGFDRQRIEAELQRLDEIERVMKLRGLKPETRAGAITAIDADRDRQLKQIDEKEQLKNVELLIARMKEEAQEAERIRKVFEEIGKASAETDKERDVIAVNDRYEERLRKLQEIALTEAASSLDTEVAAERILEIRERELRLVDEKYKRHFVGEGNALELQKRRLTLEKELLTLHQEDPDSGKRIEEIRRQMRDIDQVLALQFKTDSVSMSDAFLFGMNDMVERWGTNAERMAIMGAGLAQSFESNMTNSFTAILTGQQSVAEGFRNMTNSIIADIIRIIIQEQVSQPIAKLLSAGIGSLFGGGLGTTLPATGGPLGGFSGTVAHAGGVAGETGGRFMDMGAFMRAPRFHGGGTVGDEVPVVARRGEVIFTPEQLSALGRTISTSSRAPRIEILNQVDEQMVDRRIAANPGLILNIIASRANDVRRILS